jgi:threonine aldolase
MQEDHHRARRLEEALNNLDMIEHVLPVESNIVISRLREGVDQLRLLDDMKKKGLLAVPFGPSTIRMVTHLDVTDEKISQAKEIMDALD